MIEYTELHRILHSKPFKPFRVFCADGRIFDIRFRELNVVCRDGFVIGIPQPNNPDPFAIGLVEVPLEQIKSVEILPESAASWR